MSSDDSRNLSEKIRWLTKELGRLKKLVSATSTKQFWSQRGKADMRECVLFYFREVRSLLAARMVETSTLDQDMQVLFALTDKDGTINSYKAALTDAEKGLHRLELEAEMGPAVIAETNGPVISLIEKDILTTLQGLIPATALSYQQVLNDIADTNRVSFRGTAAEMREVLRETLDHLAPDAEVQAETGFRFEVNKTRPTMKQKARYILRLRGKASGSIDAPVKSIEAVEETVSSLVRSAYDRGSIETHTQSGMSKPSLLQLKMYVDSVLCELLEIHQKAN